MADRRTILQEDHDVREYIDSVSLSIMQIASFLSKFDRHTRHHLTVLDERLHSLERKLSFLENRATTVIPSEEDSSRSVELTVSENPTSELPSPN